MHNIGYANAYELEINGYHAYFQITPSGQGSMQLLSQLASFSDDAKALSAQNKQVG